MNKPHGVVTGILCIMNMLKGTITQGPSDYQQPTFKL